jgi:hypothetical protein
VIWRSFPWPRGSGCWSFDSLCCFISTKCGSSASVRFWNQRAHAIWFCTLVSILDLCKSSLSSKFCSFCCKGFLIFVRFIPKYLVFFLCYCMFSISLYFCFLPYCTVRADILILLALFLFACFCHLGNSFNQLSCDTAEFCTEITVTTSATSLYTWITFSAQQNSVTPVPWL